MTGEFDLTPQEVADLTAITEREAADLAAFAEQAADPAWRQELERKAAEHAMWERMAAERRREFEREWQRLEGRL